LEPPRRRRVLLALLLHGLRSDLLDVELELLLTAVAGRLGLGRGVVQVEVVQVDRAEIFLYDRCGCGRDDLSLARRAVRACGWGEVPGLIGAGDTEVVQQRGDGLHR